MGYTPCHTGSPLHASSYLPQQAFSWIVVEMDATTEPVTCLPRAYSPRILCMGRPLFISAPYPGGLGWRPMDLPGLRTSNSAPRYTALQVRQHALPQPACRLPTADIGRRRLLLPPTRNGGQAWALPTGSAYHTKHAALPTTFYSRSMAAAACTRLLHRTHKRATTYFPLRPGTCLQHIFMPHRVNTHYGTRISPLAKNTYHRACAANAAHSWLYGPYDALPGACACAVAA